MKSEPPKNLLDKFSKSREISLRQHEVSISAVDGLFLL